MNGQYPRNKERDDLTHLVLMPQSSESLAVYSIIPCGVKRDSAQMPQEQLLDRAPLILQEVETSLRYQYNAALYFEYTHCLLSALYPRH